VRKAPRFYLTGMIMIATLVLWCSYSVFPSHAEERDISEDIAESFGLCSKAIKYYHVGRLEEAIEVLERSLELDPDNREAEGYLDLIRAEVKMREEDREEVYQREADLREETDYRYEPEPEEAVRREKARPILEIEPEYFFYREDKIKSASDRLNERIAPSQIRGEYKMALGVTSEDLIWKEANGDYNERNWRMIDHNFPKMNTFDTRVYDKFKVEFDTNKHGRGLNFHTDITVDPWSFVGKTEKFTVSKTGATADKAELELKYWSGTRSVINETFYTLDRGNRLDALEHKVTDGKIPAFTVYGEASGGDETTLFSVPEQDVDFTFQPIRELWFDLNKDNYKLKVFPFALEDEALTSDDPLMLSNRHIYWEPSPWLDDWVPGQFNAHATANAFSKGRWSDDLSFFTRDSDLKRLTALRGVSFKGDFGNTDISLALASPKGLWQDYEDFNAIPGAARLKTKMTDKLTVGLIDTFRIGRSNDRTDSYNNVFGIDGKYNLNPTTNIALEVAMSKSEDDRTDSTYKTEKNGVAAHLAIEKKTPIGKAKLALTHMDEAFDPGLSNYKETRKDQFWGRHIHFKEPLKGSTSLKYEDVEPFRIGDGIDSGRKVINFRLDSKGDFDKRMDNLIDYRYVRDSEHKYVEGVFREENTVRINPDWTSKLLFIYHDLPKTKGKIDPIYYDPDTGEYLVNDDIIEEGKDPSVSTYSVGLQYAPEDWISAFGIYENTNDFTFATGDNPRGLLNDTGFTTSIIEGNRYRERNPYVYNQHFFELPPYDRFNIYRAGISLKPSRKLGIELDYAKNDFKFASGIDDNINHFSTTFRYNFTPRLRGFLKYTFSKVYDLYQLNTNTTNAELDYEKHHNVFLELNYNVTEHGLLTIQFGEGSVVSPVWGAAASPYGDFYPTLDTQHILRIYYRGVF